MVNCSTYATSGECATCMDDFFLDGPSKTCNPQNKSRNPNCQKWSVTADGTCDTCASDSFKFSVDTTCAAVFTIANCKEYKDPYSCSICESGFQLSNHKRLCLPIPESSNCLDQQPKSFGASLDDVNDINADTQEWAYDCKSCKPMFA